MSPTLDTVLTIVLFVLGAPVVAYFGLSELLKWIFEVSSLNAEPTRRFIALVWALGLVPPLLLAGPYLAALVLANVNSGLTFYYPLIAVPIAVAASAGAYNSLNEKVRDVRVPRKVTRHVPREKAGHSVINNATQAVAAITDYIHRNGIDYPTTDLAAEAFEAGWSVCAPVPVDDSDPAAFLDMPVGRAVFLIGYSGRIEQNSSSTPPGVVRQRFAEQERPRAVEADDGR